MLNLTIKQAAEVLAITPVSASDEILNAAISSVAIDSRKVQAGSLFVAIKGEQQDGHDYLVQAQNNGAIAALVEREQAVNIVQLPVANSVVAMGRLASHCRQAFNGRMIAITGSSGKTSVKEMLASILSGVGRISVTSGNQNNEIGVPLTLFSLQADSDYAVVEMGAAQKGDIEYLMHIAQPDVTAITNIGQAHVGRFGGVEVIAATKSEIYRELKADGIAVVNADEKFSRAWLNEMNGKQVIRFSISDQSADVFASDIEASSSKVSFVLHMNGQQALVCLQVPGLHNVANALCAAACANAVGVVLENIAQGLDRFVAAPSRLQIKTGNWGGVLIDDCYNANPVSVKAAIDVLVQYQAETYLVFGDMAELGDYSQQAHAEIGAYAKQQGVTYLYCVGQDSLHAANAFGESAQHFADKPALAQALQANLKANDTVLVKGSRSAAMETIVNTLSEDQLADKEAAH